MKRLLAGLVLVAAAAAPAFATDIINQDNKGYKLTIVDGSYTSTKDVSSRGSVYGVCTTGPCTFKLDNGASVTAAKGDTVYISEGKFRKV